MRRVYFEIYWLPVDALVVARNPRSLVLDFALDILEFCEPPIGNVVKLSPFWLCCYSMASMRFGSIVIGGDVDELENERSASDNAAATRKEISSNDVFEY